MELDDLPAVFHLGEELFTARDVPVLYRTWDEYEVTNFFQSDPDFCLVAEAEDDERLLGFALGTTIEKSGSAWKYGHLVWLGVCPDCQRTGVGERLFNRIVDRMVHNGVRILLVDTEADNLHALEFFRKMGFGNPSEHVFLTRNLDERRRQSPARRSQGGDGPGRGERE